ncbi:MAG: group 1 truncated hemoglobin [Rhodoglobus sp.]
MSLFDEVGGDEGVARLVDALVDGVVDDPDFASWFAGVDLDRLKSHQRSFLTVALGGPEEYTGRSIRSAHSGMAITPEAFVSFLAHVERALAGAGAGENLIREVTRHISSMRAAVVEVH